MLKNFSLIALVLPIAACSSNEMTYEEHQQHLKKIAAEYQGTPVRVQYPATYRSSPHVKTESSNYHFLGDQHVRVGEPRIETPMEPEYFRPQRQYNESLIYEDDQVYITDESS